MVAAEFAYNGWSGKMDQYALGEPGHLAFTAVQLSKVSWPPHTSSCSWGGGWTYSMTFPYRVTLSVTT